MTCLLLTAVQIGGITIGRYKVRDTTLNAHISKGYKVRLIITNGSGDVHDCSDRRFPPKLKDFKW